MINFIAKNWVDMLLIFVGLSALITYFLQEHKKKIEAASLIVLQIDELFERLREISTYIVNGQLNDTAFYESLPLMSENYWNKYKHYFIKKMDTTSYRAINDFYDYIYEIQEQQLFMKTCQKNGMFLTQTVLTNIETQLITSEMNNNMQSCTIKESNFPKDGDTNNSNQQAENSKPIFDSVGFWNGYRLKQEIAKDIINKKALTPYIPVQIQISLEKILKECKLLTIIGNDGYNLLKKYQKRKF